MANNQNLRTLSTDEAREIGKKGGIESGKRRREKRKMREILNEILNADIKTVKQFEEEAKKIGITSNKSIKETFALICLINNIKTGELKDLDILIKLLGEENPGPTNTRTFSNLYLVLDDNDDDIEETKEEQQEKNEAGKEAINEHKKKGE